MIYEWPPLIRGPRYCDKCTLYPISWQNLTFIHHNVFAREIIFHCKGGIECIKQSQAYLSLRIAETDINTCTLIIRDTIILAHSVQKLCTEARTSKKIVSVGNSLKIKSV